MRVNNFNIDLISGHVGYYQKNIPVKTNQFYRDAFINQMKEGQGLPSTLKRKIGLNNIFDDEKNLRKAIKKQIKSNVMKFEQNVQKQSPEPRLTINIAQKKRMKQSNSQHTFRNSMQDNLQDKDQNMQKDQKSEQRMNQDQENEEDQKNKIKEYIKQEQQKLYFVKGLEQKVHFYSNKYRKSQELVNKFPEIQDNQGFNFQKASQNEQLNGLNEFQKSQVNLNESSKLLNEKFQNQNINKLFYNQFEQDNLNSKNKFNRIFHTSHQQKRQSKSTTDPISSLDDQLISAKKFLDPESEIKNEINPQSIKQKYMIDGKEFQENEYKTERNQSNDQVSSNSMIYKIFKERQNHQQESYMKDIRDHSLNKQQNIQNEQYITQNNQQQSLQNLSQAQYYQGVDLNNQQLLDYSPHIRRKSDNFIIGNLNTITPGMYTYVNKGNEQILSAPVVLTKYQINQHFQNSQTISNYIREKVNSEHRKELLSFFNENRYKYFSNNDLNAEKFFVTRNRERIKDLNFERIGIFKSKQPQTHVKNFRFFINDIQVQEPRFQNPLKTEQVNIMQAQSRKASHASQSSKLSSPDYVQQNIPTTSDPPTQRDVPTQLGTPAKIDKTYKKNILKQKVSLNEKDIIDDRDNLNKQNTISLTSIINIKGNNEQKQIPASPPNQQTDFNQLILNEKKQSFKITNQENTALETVILKSSTPQKRNSIKNSTGQNFHLDLNKLNEKNEYYTNSISNKNDDSENLKNLKQQYLNFVQQNMYPQQQQINQKNNIHQKQAKEESLIVEESSYQITEESQHKLTSLNNIANPMLSSKKSNKNPKKILKVQLNENNLKDIKNTKQISEENSSQNIAITEYDDNGEKILLHNQNNTLQQKSKNQSDNIQESNEDGHDLLFNAKQDTINNEIQTKQEKSNELDHQDDQLVIMKLISGQNEQDQNQILYLNSEQDRQGEYIYSDDFQEQIKSLEEEKQRLESIEDLFFLKLKDKEVIYYNSENFKIQRKKVLLDTVLKNKKITTRDKKLIFQNLIYQYDINSGFHSKEWCIQMTKFLMTNKFKYNLDEAANRKYERAHQKIIQLPTFRDPVGEYQHDIYNYVSQLAQPSPISTEENEVHFSEQFPDFIYKQLDYDTLPIKRFKPKQLAKEYSHLQFQKFKY